MTNYVVQITFKSIHNDFEKTLDFLTIPTIANQVPGEPIHRENLNIPKNLPLADPEFHIPAAIDILIGSGPTLSLLCMGQVNLSKKNNDLYLQKTRLGWIIGGNFDYSKRINSIKCHLSSLQDTLSKFWEIEEGQDKTLLSKEENECEQFFSRTVNRSTSGRYEVALPFKSNHTNLGSSYTRALKRLRSLQNKFERDYKFKEHYTKVINEYISMGHMTEIANSSETDGFYLPHQAVIKNSSSTTKLRVVFDGSAKTSTGVSLNDILMIGPTIQDNLISHILRFRTYKYVITADIEKMYRQILMRKQDRKFQKILWESESTLKTFELNTVTFGLSPAPFLAIRCLSQLADDEGDKFPLARHILKKHFYVDNLLTGGETIQDVIQIRDQLIRLTNRAGLNLRQWAANDERILQDIQTEHTLFNLQFDEDPNVKTLGIIWDAKHDVIKYTVNLSLPHHTKTKRAILSEIARIFDPLGLLGPIILYAKQIMQELWKLKLNWDETVPTNIYTWWQRFYEQLSALSEISFDRRILIDNYKTLHLHGFCDASEKGYGACVYVRSRDRQDNILVRLIYAKSRVAPLKTICLPRLELCGAKLLVNVVNEVINDLNLKFETITYWSDSTITLNWIKTSPHLLKTFVANRVSEIQSHSTPEQWRHIVSKENPADALSRGQLPYDFLKNQLWFKGPQWLQFNESLWPQSLIKEIVELPEIKKNTCLLSHEQIPGFLSLYSSYSLLIRVIAYCLRFRYKVNNSRLELYELERAEKKIIKIIQATSFNSEIKSLTHSKELAMNSKIRSLTPFLDEEQILRVGGRLKHSTLPYAAQHPILLPKSNFVTDLIIQQHHIQGFHSGIQTTLYSIRQKYWIIHGKSEVRRVVRKCIKCFRADPPKIEYIMGNLPKFRITEARPFVNVGIDYCGPFFIKERKFRNRNKIKIYVAVFVCFVVKAVHLEVVSDMTTEGFIAALKRFVARRGKPLHIFSDNGTNFVGANNQLKEIYALFNSDNHQSACIKFADEMNIQWHFNPPASPHVGGLWEASVKLFKHHVKRVITDSLLTFEEFNTFVIEVEAIINSRPLTPISNDPNDLLVLTPGHFLIGESLTSIPSHDFSDIPTNRLSNWQHLQKIRQHFWGRWSKEYLNELNVRSKWSKGHHSIREGTLVIIKDDNLPPMQWRLGRVIKLHPGHDGILRTVVIKTASGELKRNVKGVAPLPVEYDVGKAS